MRIYLESTIPSYVVARPARDIIQAARQQLSRDWWELQREKHELFISQIVLDEIAFGEEAMAQRQANPNEEHARTHGEEDKSRRARADRSGCAVGTGQCGYGDQPRKYCIVAKFTHGVLSIGGG